MIKVYLAAYYPNRIFLRYLANDLKKSDIHVISRWIWEDERMGFLNDVSRDFQGVDQCDVFISFYPWITMGTTSEMAYAVGRDKPCIAVVDGNCLPDFCEMKPNQYSEFFSLAKYKLISDCSDLPVKGGSLIPGKRLIISDLTLLKETIEWLYKLTKDE